MEKFTIKMKNKKENTEIENIIEDISIHHWYCRKDL